MAPLTFKVRPWRALYTIGLTLWAMYALRWLALVFMIAIQLDLQEN